MKTTCKWLIGLFVMLAAVSCTPSPASVADTATPLLETDTSTPISIPATAEPSSPPASSTPPESEPAPSPTATDIPEQAEPSKPPPQPDPSKSPPDVRAKLDAEGPWLLFLAAAGPEKLPYLWGVNSDGSGLGRLSAEPVLNFAVHPGRAADNISLVATIGTSPEEIYHDLSLNLLTLPHATETRITTLTSEQTGLGSGEKTSDEKMDIAVGISHHDSLTWSPDGRWLAFAGAMDGPSVDLYSYELASGAIRWLTDGPSHAYQFLWSADSSLILQSARYIFLGAGGPYEAGEGIWGAHPDGSSIVTYEGPEAARFVGWQDDSHLLIDSGPRNGCMTWGRVLDLSAGTIERNGLGCFGPVAYDPTGQFALAYTRDQGTDLDDWGIDLVNLNTGEPIDVMNQLAHEIYWDDHAQLFVAAGDFGLIGVTLAGEMVEAPIRTAMPSPDGQFAAHYSLLAAGEGVWVSAGGSDPVQMLEEDGRWLNWAPDSSGLFVVTPHQELYLVSTPALDAIQLSADLWPRQSWVLPDNQWYSVWAP